ncbi:hypothetical protein CMI45_03300 [Candidatus Pacearchaeota archaeon]|nr:hypothetical protein [Candidatus Pacearchaeota archaeon]|tara:strand:+ start:1054 stop:1650 length:597 start_codon:yes stop_codon:yes gene_type:complete
MKTNKKAAIEMSIGTIVVIVIAMSMLILGLVLVKNIFQTSTESVDILSDKVKNEIGSLFTDEKADVVIRLGSDRTVKVKPGSDTIGVGVGARTLDGATASPGRLKYRLTLQEPAKENCAQKLGLTKANDLFLTATDTFIEFDELSGSNAFAIVQLKIPKGTAICTQKVLVDVKDTTLTDNSDVGRTFFILEVLKESVF